MDIYTKLSMLLGKVVELSNSLQELESEIEDIIDELDKELDDELDDEDEENEDDIKIGLSEQSKSPDELGTFFLPCLCRGQKNFRRIIYMELVVDTSTTL